MSDRQIPHIPPRNYEGKDDKDDSLKKLKKQGYIPRIYKEKTNDD